MKKLAFTLIIVLALLLMISCSSEDIESFFAGHSTTEETTTTEEKTTAEETTTEETTETSTQEETTTTEDPEEEVVELTAEEKAKISWIDYYLKQQEYDYVWVYINPKTGEEVDLNISDFEDPSLLDEKYLASIKSIHQNVLDSLDMSKFEVIIPSETLPIIGKVQKNYVYKIAKIPDVASISEFSIGKMGFDEYVDLIDFENDYPKKEEYTGYIDSNLTEQLNDPDVEYVRIAVYAQEVDPISMPNYVEYLQSPYGKDYWNLKSQFLAESKADGFVMDMDFIDKMIDAFNLSINDLSSNEIKSLMSSELSLETFFDAYEQSVNRKENYTKIKYSEAFGAFLVYKQLDFSQIKEAYFYPAEFILTVKKEYVSEIMKISNVYMVRSYNQSINYDYINIVPDENNYEFVPIELKTSTDEIGLTFIDSYDRLVSFLGMYHLTVPESLKNISFSTNSIIPLYRSYRPFYRRVIEYTDVSFENNTITISSKEVYETVSGGRNAVQLFDLVIVPKDKIPSNFRIDSCSYVDNKETVFVIVGDRFVPEEPGVAYIPAE